MNIWFVTVYDQDKKFVFGYKTHKAAYKKAPILRYMRYEVIGPASTHKSR